MLKKRSSLLGSTIGMHVRHSLEFFTCITSALEVGAIDYDQRRRNPVLELDIDAVVETIHKITSTLVSDDRKLLLHTQYPTGPIVIGTSYFRELVYAIEHSIHHFAMVRVALLEVANLQVPPGFGFAFSTLEYMKSQSVK